MRVLIVYAHPEPKSFAYAPFARMLAEWESYFGDFITNRAASHPNLAPLVVPEAVTNWKLDC